MFRGSRSIRLRTMLILIAGCATLCGLGVQLYRQISPVQKSARQIWSGNSLMARVAAVSNLSNTRYLRTWEREDAYRILLPTVKHPDAQVRSVVAIALSQYREHAADIVPALIGLTKDEAPRVRESALLGLENLSVNGSPHANEIARGVIAVLDDPAPAVRLEAGRALYVLGQGSRAAPALARLVREETGNHRLGSLGFLMAMKSVPSNLKPTLNAMLSSDYVWDRIWARQALIQIGMPIEVRDAMINTMLESAQAAERLEGAGLLIQLGRSSQALPVLVEIETSGSEADRARASVLLHEATKARPDQP